MPVYVHDSRGRSDDGGIFHLSLGIVPRRSTWAGHQNSSRLANDRVERRSPRGQDPAIQREQTTTGSAVYEHKAGLGWILVDWIRFRDSVDLEIAHSRASTVSGWEVRKVTG